MKRTMIDYGIDLGTTNSAIARIDTDNAKIIKSLDEQKDTTPSCISFTKKAMLAGNKAYSAYRSDSLKALANAKEVNSFVEFKRTMGTDETYSCPNSTVAWSSEGLSSEILKYLKSFVNDENISAAVITIPAAYTNNQIDAVRRAAALAGLNQIEVLQEPIAAATAYGLSNKNDDGYWLVFDFGGGTFDAALVKIEEGIIKVIDTEGDNYLGGKDLDFAIVDQLIIPHIAENFEIDNWASSGANRSALKFFAEEIKNTLSFNESHNIYIDPGDCGEDDEGEEIEIDLTVTQTELEAVLSRVFQKSIDASLSLLKRNNLSGDSLASLILVGGPTLSPILRDMLSQQICKPDTSVDPMTVVAVGAAHYASTIPLSEDIQFLTRDRSKIQLGIEFEPTTVELEEFITLKILEDKTDGTIPETVYAEVKRGDGAWSSGKVEIDNIGEVVDIQLAEHKTNTFTVSLLDNRGNNLECEPSSFNVIQGTKIGSAPLPHNFGIGVKDKNSDKIIFKGIKGLEKNKNLPAVGLSEGLKTQTQIRPGNSDDKLKIPLYQGDHYAENTRAILNLHVYDVIITGDDLPALLPENSEVNLTIKLDNSQAITVQAFFPYLDEEIEILVPTNDVQSTDSFWLESEIDQATDSLIRCKASSHHASPPELQEIQNELEEINTAFHSDRDSVDQKQQSLGRLKNVMKKLDSLEENTAWPELEANLKTEFERLEQAQNDLGDAETAQQVSSLKQGIEQAIREQNKKLGQKLLEEINTLFFKLTMVYQLINIIRDMNDSFDSYHWADSRTARSLINQGIDLINEHPTVDNLRPVAASLFALLPQDEKPAGDSSFLVG